MASVWTSFLWFSLPLLLGTQIRSFTQADLTSGDIQYVHSSNTEKHSDAFGFTLSDGISEVGKALRRRPQGTGSDSEVFVEGSVQSNSASFTLPCSHPKIVQREHLPSA